MNLTYSRGTVKSREWWVRVVWEGSGSGTLPRGGGKASPGTSDSRAPFPRPEIASRFYRPRPNRDLPGRLENWTCPLARTAFSFSTFPPITLLCQHRLGTFKPRTRGHANPIGQQPFPLLRLLHTCPLALSPFQPRIDRTSSSNLRMSLYTGS